MSNCELLNLDSVKPIRLEVNAVKNFEKVNELKDWIIGNLPLFGMIKVESNGREVQFSKTSINRSLKGVYRDEVKRNSYAILKELVEGSFCLKIREADFRHDNKVLGQELYYNALIYKGMLYGVQIIVDIPKNETSPYIYAGHKVKRIKEAVCAASEVSPNGLTFVRPDTANISIADIVEVFNPDNNKSG